MSLEYRTTTTIPEDGVVVLPDDFRGKVVSIIVRDADLSRSPLKTRIEDTSVFALKGLLKGHTGEWSHGILSIAGILKNCVNKTDGDERYDYLMEKYAHDRDPD